MMRQFRLAPLLCLSLLGGRVAQAQLKPDTRPVTSDSACTYRQCSLVIVPVWNGLDVVRSSEDARVAHLSFFFPRNIGSALRGPDRDRIGADSAFAHALRAVELRQAAASFTDFGAVAIVIAALRAGKERNVRTGDKIIGSAGLAVLLISVPIQFAADGELSLAVWWHNLRYAP